MELVRTQSPQPNEDYCNDITIVNHYSYWPATNISTSPRDTVIRQITITTNWKVMSVKVAVATARIATAMISSANPNPILCSILGGCVLSNGQTHWSMRGSSKTIMYESQKFSNPSLLLGRRVHLCSNISRNQQWYFTLYLYNENGNM